MELVMGGQPHLAEASSQLTTELTDLAGRFRDEAGSLGAWPAEKCAERMAELCAGAGRVMFPLVRSIRSLWSEMPAWMLQKRSDPDMAKRKSHDALWWLAFVGWLELHARVAPRGTHGVSYHREVFERWRPDLQFRCCHVDLVLVKAMGWKRTARSGVLHKNIDKSR